MKQVCLIYLSISLLWGCTYRLDSREQYRKDVHYFFQSLRELHPAPYTRISKDSFNLLEKKILEECCQMKSIKDLNVALMSCNQYFDGHTRCRIFPGLFRLMPAFKWLIEVRNDSVFWQPTGEHVVAIDTFESFHFLAKVKNFVPYDFSLKNKNLEYTKSSFFYLLNDFNLPYYIDLYNTDICKIYRQALDKYRKYTSVMPARAPIYNFKYFPEDSIAVFQYNTSNIVNLEQFQDSVQFFFDRIEELSIKYLFIDVRKNGGGSDIVHQPIYRCVEFITNNIEYEHEWTSAGKRVLLKKLLETSYLKGQRTRVWKEMVRTYWEADKMTEKKSFVQEGHNGYNKEIFILQGEKTFSAAYNFCWVMRLLNPHCLLVGTIVGQSNPVFGNRIDLQLPYTKIPFSIATSKHLYNYCLSEENGFLKPDIYYSFQREDTVLLSELKQIIKLKYKVCTN